MENNDTCCLAKILKVIDILQKECSNECVREGCDRPFLGLNGCYIYNTRPITLYTRSGDLFNVNYYLNNQLTTSSVFRVENVKGCCATLRVLNAPTLEDSSTFTATSEFVTVNLECFCILRCLDDTFLEI